VIAKALRVRELPIVIAFVLVFLFFLVAAPRFATAQNLQAIVTETALLAILAAAETPVILTRNVDVSVGSIVGMTAFFTAQLLAQGTLKGWFTPLVLSLAIGAALGLLNGVIIVFGRVSSIIATLGTMSVYRGLLFVIMGGQQIYAYQIPQGFLSIYSTSVLGIPLFGIVALAVLIPGSLVLKKVPWARELYAIGSNPSGAQAIGIPVGWRTIVAFVWCGLLAGLVGYLFIAEFASVTATSAEGMELTAIAAAVVGGVSLFGGSGSLAGAMLGALILSVLPNGLALMNVSEFLKIVLQGALIVAATAFHTALGGQLTRLGARRPAPSPSAPGRATSDA
jgi:ribose/xylose/arabinose/galactoside ABC-type transport system permease subunit